MRHLMRLWGICVGVMGFGVVAVADTPFEFGAWKKGENLIVGGDFEDLVPAGPTRFDLPNGKRAWTLEDGTCCGRGAEYRWELDKTTFHSGKQSLKVIGVKASGTDWHAKIRHEGTSMKGGRDYTVAFWAKAEKPRTVSLSVQLQHDPWDFFQGGDFNLTKEWVEYTKTFTAPKDIDRDMWVGLAIAKTAETFWVDDFRFWEGKLDDEIAPEPKPRAVAPQGKLSLTWAALKQ